MRGRLKTDASRRQVPIEPALVPLLTALVKAYPEGSLFDVARSDGKGGASDMLRLDLQRAGCKRPDLYRDDATHQRFTFHGLRHTAVTHWAVSGKTQTWLQLVAGHSDPAHTRPYLDAASIARASFGQPHPPIPDVLLEGLIPYAVADMTEDMTVREETPHFYGQKQKTPGRTIRPGVDRLHACQRVAVLLHLRPASHTGSGTERKSSDRSQRTTR